MSDDLAYGPMVEAVYDEALTAIAAGVPREGAWDYCRRHYRLDVFDQAAVFNAALTDSAKAGIEREDIDDSWFRNRREGR